MHIPAAYVGIVRTIRFLAPDVVDASAVAGTGPPGQQRHSPAVNAVQTLVARRENEIWRIALFQNTPAADPWLLGADPETDRGAVILALGVVSTCVSDRRHELPYTFEVSGMERTMGRFVIVADDQSQGKIRTCWQR